ncbi:MAG: MBL fold metallo-hydrolase [Deltaproteobacteria bacterium]|nr:MBL fold metallo-hydrolase [Deltaproteobacteria bacterium]
MADYKKRLKKNVPGNFYVDKTCINCDACRQLAPKVFSEDSGFSYVYKQPKDELNERQALEALLACPTHSIGALKTNLKARNVMHDFPLWIADNVFYLGFHSDKSFGASSYFIEDPQGNWMIDSPRYQKFLCQQIREKGGLKYIFLTHQDDIADAEKYAREFGAQRILHKYDANKNHNVEILIQHSRAFFFTKDFLIIPTPGHTKGHCVLLYKNKFLFSGDHLWWSRRTHSLGASKQVCWYSWEKQLESLKKLLEYRFTYVLPGHGRRVNYPNITMHQALEHAIFRLESI